MIKEDLNIYEVKKEPALSTKEETKRKQRVLAHGTPSITRSISSALVLKNENIFFLTDQAGNVPLEGNHGYGLYYHDCRYLSGYELRLAHSPTNILVSTALTGYSSIVELTNPEIKVDEGVHIHQDDLGIQWERVLDGNRNQLLDRITLQNHSHEDIHFPISLAFQSHFEDIFSIRGLLQMHPGLLMPPRWQDKSLVFEYAGRDGIERKLNVHFSPTPSREVGTTAHFWITLKARERKEIQITLQVDENDEKLNPSKTQLFQETAETVDSEFRRISQDWLTGNTVMDCKGYLAKKLLNRSLTDLRTLRSSLDHDHYFAAGVPWFATLFGRDSLISSMQMLAFNPKIAAETLRLLAKYQAKENLPWRDAQVGKILHELRVGELARLGEIPHTPYYGSVDATPLFLILISKTCAWTGSLDLFNELRENIAAALGWIDRFGDSNGDGYVDYQSLSDHGLMNQGWKDSAPSIMNADGSLAVSPIALAEVQGYVYRAKVGIATLFERAGDRKKADRLRMEAAELQERFNRDFWSEKNQTYVLAIQNGGKPADVVASNAGQVLWSGIAEPEKAHLTAKRLMAEDMFNGWGIRTLSSLDNSYNPTGYHIGTVWPFDTAMIAIGFRRYGLDEQALRLFSGIFEASSMFDAYRLPELFAGFPRDVYQVPVHYPVACHPQAWSAGCIPQLLIGLLGLVPNAFEHRLNIVRPRLPEFIGPIDVRGLEIGDACVDLGFEPSDEGQAKVKIINVEGNLDIQIVSSDDQYDF